MREIWKDVPGYEGKYQVSSLGRIKCLGYYEMVVPKSRKPYKRYHKETILKLAKRTKGLDYLCVDVCVDGVVKLLSVHTLVALAFPEICGERFDGAEISHLDENPVNNTPENLRWVTHKVNNNWGTRTEKAMQKIRKPVWQMTKDGYLIKRFPSAYHIERELGYRNQTIANACRRKHNIYGYKWVKEEDFHPFVLRLLCDVYVLSPLLSRIS